MSITYRKVRFFTPGVGATAGLVLDDSWFPANLQAVSRLYPHSEARYMQRFEVSAPYPSWEGAFNHEFREV